MDRYERSSSIPVQTRAKSAIGMWTPIDGLYDELVGAGAEDREGNPIDIAMEVEMLGTPCRELGLVEAWQPGRQKLDWEEEIGGVSPRIEERPPRGARGMPIGCPKDAGV